MHHWKRTIRRSKWTLSPCFLGLRVSTTTTTTKRGAEPPRNCRRRRPVGSSLLLATLGTLQLRPISSLGLPSSSLDTSVAYHYFFSSQVCRSVVYGDQPRNRLDLFLPKNSDGPKPVLAFVTGGAWIIGYKAWGALLGKQLAERDIIVACIDYRNFPQGTISDMVEDASQGISFVCNNIVEYGGDLNRIYLMGQSAGAHISACALLEQAIKESKGGSISWSVSQLKAYFGLSGGYNMPNLVDHFHGRGLYRSIFLSLMEGEQSLQHFSPEIRIQDPSLKRAVGYYTSSVVVK